MRFRLIPYLMLLIVLLPFPGGSSRHHEFLRLNILQKYSLREINVGLPAGTLQYRSNSFDLSKKNIQITADGERLKIKIMKRSLHKVSTALITAEEPFSLSFSSGERSFNRSYLGSLEIHVRKGRLLLINITPMEPYIRAAARAELGPLLANRKGSHCKAHWRKELLASMEIAIRSYLVYFKSRHSDSLYQFCDLTHCVYFPGVQHLEKGETTDTPGTVMVDEKRKPVCAYFHSSSGGTLTGPEVFWPRHQKSPHYRRGPDRIHFWESFLSHRSPHENWRVRISNRTMGQICRVSSLREIHPRYIDKRVTSLMLIPRKGRPRRISIALFMSRAGKQLGWNIIKSNFFTMAREGDSWVFNGRGLGHGIGLSQWSARELACRGYTAREILSFYYNEPELETWQH